MKKNAFSLIELLVSLIIISLIVSSFIPLITKKIKHQNTAIANGVVSCKKFGEKCLVCDNKNCKLCSTQINLKEGYEVDPSISCEEKECPNNCVECKDGACTTCKDGFELQNGKCDLGSCIKIGKTCVQRFNAGDKGGLKIPDNLVEFYNTQESGVTGTEHSRAICYRGKTSDNCSEEADYSACTRTVCSWFAAVKICSYYGLRLPTVAEAAAYSGYVKELQLCSNNQISNIPMCKSSNKCLHADSTGICVPDALWCQRKDGLTAPPHNNSLNGGPNYRFKDSWLVDLSGNPNCNSGGYSVRCVKDL